MAVPVILPDPVHLDVPEDLRAFLKLRETASDYLVTTLSGETLIRAKAGIRYPWELLQGIWDAGPDTTQERRREREWELAHDARTFGA